jgi:hypothetical protein
MWCEEANVESRPTSQQSLEGLRRLKHEARERGEESFAVLLAGVELYITLGREFDLIEIMKRFADEMKDPVENTPTAEDLRRLYNEGV